MEIYKSPDYEFKMIVIKPNNCSVDGSSENFEENFYKIVKHDIKNGPIVDDQMNKCKNTLLKYLLSRDYLMAKNMKFNSLLVDFEKFINPNGVEGKSYEVKTCLDTNDELIMFMYDASNKNTNQFNHMATIFGPNFETVFGPVFITKILKDNLGKPVKHVDITHDDLINIWMNTKQVDYWDFENNEWKIKSMFNNNKSIDTKQYQHTSIDKHLLFYKLKQPLLDVNNFIKKNINNTDELSKYFENIKICKLKIGEYVNEELKYNIDIGTIHEHIINTAINGFDDYNKYQVVMESIFVSVDKNSIVSL
jgi:hypothetical protein